MQRIGTISSIHRYPVKSMGGERLPEAALTLEGIPGDRMYAFVQAGSKSTFPWLTGREAPTILHYSARATRLQDGQRPVVEVTTPSGALLAADSEALLEELQKLSGQALHCLADYRGSFDVAPITLMAETTVGAIARASDTAADPLRFRMNFYIATDDQSPFLENGWVGRVVRIGDQVRVAVTQPDKRCVMITLDNPTSAGSPRVLRAVAEMNEARAGVYAVVLGAGTAREGNPVWLED